MALANLRTRKPLAIFSFVSRRGHHRGGDRYIVLADYMALTTREIDLSEDDVVELVKVGCAGWWYVRLSTYPYPEGWAPSTYLEKLHDRT